MFCLTVLSIQLIVTCSKNKVTLLHTITIIMIVITIALFPAVKHDWCPYQRVSGKRWMDVSIDGWLEQGRMHGRMHRVHLTGMRNKESFVIERLGCG